MAVHIGLHQNGKDRISRKSSCLGREEAFCGSVAWILWYKNWEIYRQAIPTSPDMDNCWLPDIKNAIGEPQEGITLVLGGGLWTSWDLCLCAQQNRSKEVFTKVSDSGLVHSKLENMIFGEPTSFSLTASICKINNSFTTFIEVQIDCNLSLEGRVLWEPFSPLKTIWLTISCIMYVVKNTWLLNSIWLITWFSIFLLLHFPILNLDWAARLAVF